MSSDIGRTSKGTISLAHGAGGKAMHDLIEQVFLRRFDNPLLRPLEDQARVDLASLAAQGDRLALTTDSFVVDPLFFPGGDIGRLAVCGTVNDLAVGGARPLFLTCGFIIEEGLAAHARHWRTGAPMPAELIGKLRAARNAEQGFATVEYLASALLDLELHVREAPPE